MTEKYHHIFRTFDHLLRPSGYEQVTVLSSAVGLSNIPENAIGALIQAESQNVRWRADGSNPSTTVGMLLNAGYEFWCSMDLRKIKFIEVTGSAKLNVHYFTS